MNENYEKFIWVLVLFILLFLSDKFSNIIGILVPYSIYMGSYFRGKNWFLGWKKVN